MVEVLEGKWEEILERGSELKGLRVRVEVISPPNSPIAQTPSAGQRTLAALSELEAFKPTEEEQDVLDGFEEFRREHPLTFGELRDLR
jgi:hypothetical protein